MKYPGRKRNFARTKKNGPDGNNAEPVRNSQKQENYFAAA